MCLAIDGLPNPNQGKINNSNRLITFNDREAQIENLSTATCQDKVNSVHNSIRFSRKEPKPILLKLLDKIENDEVFLKIFLQCWYFPGNKNRQSIKERKNRIKTHTPHTQRRERESKKEKIIG